MGASAPSRSRLSVKFLPADDLDRARRAAERKGLPYQTYIKLLLREGLDREEKVGRRAQPSY